MSLSQRALILIGIPLAFQLACVAIILTLVQQIEVECVKERHSQDVQNRVNVLVRLWLDRSGAKMLHKVSGDPQADLRFHELQLKASDQTAQLERVMVKDPTEYAAVQKVRQISNFIDAKMRAKAESTPHGTMEESVKLIPEFRSLMATLFDACDELVQQQADIARSLRKAQSRYRNDVQVTLMVALLGSILAAALLSFFFSRSTLERLNRLMKNAAAISAHKEPAPELSGLDELGQLDHALHTMYAALRESSQREQALINNVLDVICSLDKEMNIISVNPACESVWGYAPNELLGKPMPDLLARDDRERSVNALKEIMAKGGSERIENIVLKKDKTPAHMQWSFYPATGGGAFCMVHDISERIRVDQLKRDFVAMVSHDLRTPLSSIQGIHELVAAGIFGELNDNGKQRIHDAQENTERLMGLVNELLEMDKLEAGEMQLVIEECLPRELLQSAARAVEGVARRQQVNIVIECADDSPVPADKMRITEVLINLASNAVKFSSPEHAVTLGEHRQNGQAEFFVRDTGRGIPDELQGKIFDRFKQVEKSDSSVKGGFGLGLAICKAIVEQHGGAIRVESQVKKGSTFYFTLPLSQETQSA
jgi:PAS domain S-box-containing protein